MDEEQKLENQQIRISGSENSKKMGKPQLNQIF